MHTRVHAIHGTLPTVLSHVEQQTIKIRVPVAEGVKCSKQTICFGQGGASSACRRRSWEKTGRAILQPHTRAWP
jgi:hypothetical protein